jgi:hypothetical protein
MSIFDDLTVIDDFEESFGFTEALARARNFMIAYLCLMTKAVPEPTRRSIEVAKQYAIGACTAEELRIQRDALWQWLKERHAVVDYTTPLNAIVHAGFGPLTEGEDLKPAEVISERVSDFLDCANAFENHSESVPHLLNEHFPLARGLG